jgi:hypothetical protein
MVIVDTNVILIILYSRNNNHPPPPPFLGVQVCFHVKGFACYVKYVTL